jgi:hypothetical protein
MCLSELFKFFWDSLGDPNKVIVWLIMFPICGYIGFKFNNFLEKYLGFASMRVVYIIIIITLFAAGIIRWC